ncbi:MAG: hypothetical protein GPJ54_14230 [Candidatus Heimdallarchaeota archaeon]|nr:hypothetical protein [Candidatus Heimdallarchaeota archaeon]
MENYSNNVSNVLLNVILPILMVVSIIIGIILNLIHHTINLRDVLRLNYATHGIRYNFMIKIWFFIPYFSIIAKQKMLKDHLEQFHNDEELPTHPIYLFFILAIFLGVGIFILVDMSGGYIIENILGNLRQLIFFLLTLFLNPIPLRYYEFNWQTMMNLHIQNHLNALN